MIDTIKTRTVIHYNIRSVNHLQKFTVTINYSSQKARFGPFHSMWRVVGKVDKQRQSADHLRQDALPIDSCALALDDLGEGLLNVATSVQFRQCFGQFSDQFGSGANEAADSGVDVHELQALQVLKKSSSVWYVV